MVPHNLHEHLPPINFSPSPEGVVLPYIPPTPELVIASLAHATEYWRHEAQHDDLTGLLKRKAWESDIATRISKDQAFGVGFMDMNDFKLVNDTFGHKRGDEVLQAFSSHMRSSFLRKSDAISHRQITAEVEDPSGITLARWAGDEFGLTFSLDDNLRRGKDETGQVKSFEERLQDQHTHLKGVIKEFVQSLPAEIRNLGFDISVGIEGRDKGDTIEASDLIKAIDASMYEHKAQLKHEAVKKLPPLRRTLHAVGSYITRLATDTKVN